MIRPRLARIPKHELIDIILIGIGVATLVGIVTVFVINREGDIAWDDAEYLYQSFEAAQMARDKGTWEPLRAIKYASQVYHEPHIKPTFLHAWIAQSWLLFGGRSIIPVLVFSTAVPTGLLAVGVIAVAWRLFGSRVALLSSLCLGISPMMLYLNAHVLVETFLSLWILLIFYYVSILIEQPNSITALLLGAAIAMAFLTKFTVPVLLLGAVLYASYACLHRRLIDTTFARVIACIVLPVIVLAGPWYFRNGRSVVWHAHWSSRFETNFTGGAITPRGERLIHMTEDLFGWPLFIAVIVVGLWTFWPRQRGMIPPGGAGRSFIKVATSGAAFGAAILLLTSHFESRFLLPVWPAMAIVIGALLQGFMSEGRPWRSVATASVLAIGLGCSITSLYGQPRRVTYWNLGGVIQRLAANPNIRTLGVLGDTADWNVNKVRLIADLNKVRWTGVQKYKQQGCLMFVSLQTLSPDEVKRELDRIDALAFLDRRQIPDHVFRDAPLINRGYAIIDQALRERADRFAEVEADPEVPRRYHIYVRRVQRADHPGVERLCSESRPEGPFDRVIGRVRSRQCQGFPRNPGRFHPGSGLSPSLDQLGAIEREASFL
jgi:hypothetical protein